jgi:hypothetical protein
MATSGCGRVQDRNGGAECWGPGRWEPTRPAHLESPPPHAPHSHPLPLDASLGVLVVSHHHSSPPHPSQTPSFCSFRLAVSGLGGMQVLHRHRAARACRECCGWWPISGASRRRRSIGQLAQGGCLACGLEHRSHSSRIRTLLARLRTCSRTPHRPVSACVALPNRCLLISSHISSAVPKLIPRPHPCRPRSLHCFFAFATLTLFCLVWYKYTARLALSASYAVSVAGLASGSL